MRCGRVPEKVFLTRMVAGNEPERLPMLVADSLFVFIVGFLLVESMGAVMVFNAEIRILPTVSLVNVCALPEDHSNSGSHCRSIGIMMHFVSEK